MKSQGSLVTVGLIALVLGVGAGCKKDEPPKPDPAAQAPPHAKPPPRVNTRNPVGAKIDPQEMKNYRLDVCYYGTLSFRQARDAYLGSLGKDEPSEKKIPSFTALPAAGVAKAPPAPPKPAAPPGAAASASAPPAASPAGRLDIAMHMPHERNARACTIAATLKDPAMGDVDGTIATYAPFAADLAKDITSAAQYYQQQDYKKDSFAKGKELDKKLREGFAKLDEMQDKLRGALLAWHKDHAPDASKMADGEKLARGAIDDARDVFMLVVTKKADGEAWKSAGEKLDKAVEALKAYAGAHQADTWTRIMGTPLDVFVKTIKEAKVTPEKGFDSETFLSTINNFVGLIEARQRSVSRATMSRGPMVPPPATPSAAAPEPAPPPQP